RLPRRRSRPRSEPGGVVRRVGAREELLAEVRIVVANAGPDLPPLVEVEEGDELEARDDLASEAQPRGLPGGEGVWPRVGVAPGEGERRLDDDREVLEEWARDGRPDWHEREGGGEVQ